MNSYSNFHYNPDFEWYQATVPIGKERVDLLIADANSFDFPLLHQHFVKIIRWIENERELLLRLCLIRLLGYLPPNFKINEVRILCISLEKEGKFEILLKYVPKEDFILLIFDGKFELISYQIDT